MLDEKVYLPRSWWRNPSGSVPITAKPSELMPGSVVNVRDTPLDAFAPGVFRMVGGSFCGKFFAFAPDAAGVMELSWRGYRFTRSR